LYWLLKKKSQEFDIKVVFANTGNENEETLIFVDKCSKLFNVDVTWIESIPTYCILFNKKRVVTSNYSLFQKIRKFEIKRNRTPKIFNSSSRFEIVDFETASRKGEPFEKVIQKYGIPTKNFLHCTRELKLNPITKYMRSIGWSKGDYYTAVGIRVDEIDRVKKNYKEEKIYYPLVGDQEMTKPKVNYWWSLQPFRLNLKGYQGNCKDCFKKTQNKLLTIAIEDEGMFDFTKRMTDKYGRYEAYQRRSGKSYKQIKNHRVNFFRDNMTPIELIYLSTIKIFKRSVNDSDVYDFEGVDMDVSNGCSESCEIY